MSGRDESRAGSTAPGTATPAPRTALDAESSPAPTGSASPRARLRRTFRKAARAARRLRTSLLTRCVACVLAYAAVVVLVIHAINFQQNELFENAFPSMENVAENCDALERDQFNVLLGKEFDNCQIIIFDDRGTTLYASSQGISEHITANDIDIINDYQDHAYYEVFRTSSAGAARYLILRCSTDAQTGEKRVLQSCTVDEDLNVVDGSLFRGREALSEREFNLIRGVYEKNLSVERCDYASTEGEGRTLVLVTPMVSDAAYQKVVEQANALWLWAVPALALATAGATLYLIRTVRSAVKPLDLAITARKRREGNPAAAEDVPVELRPVFENFTELMERLDRAQDEQQRMIADISHDLKTPLTVIRGYAQAFTDGRVPPESAQAYHEVIAERAVAAAELLDELLSYAKMRHPSFQPSFERADLCEQARLAVIAATPQVEQAGCAIEADVPDEPLVARVDARLLQRALLNLIGNACAHNAAGTRVGVSCRAAGDRVLLTVADTGKGFDPGIAARAFEPFVTENAARAAGKGTGLGLAIVQRVAELHGGTARVETQPAAPWSCAVTMDLPR